MEVVAYDLENPLNVVTLGTMTLAAAQQLWANHIKKAQERKVQVFLPFRAARPLLFDRGGRIETFSFVAGRSYGGPGQQNAIGNALLNMESHPDAVPTLCNLQFTATGVVVFLVNCAITKVDLVEKSSAHLRWSYTVTGGQWSQTVNPL